MAESHDSPNADFDKRDRPPAPDEGSRELVDRDAPCLGCGYNLKGLIWRGRCPECAAPIWISLQEKRLCYADPHWLRRVRRGSKLAVAGLLIPFAAFLPMLAVPCTNDPAIHTLVSYAMAITLAIGGLCWAAGLWEITAPNPADATAESLWSPRRTARSVLLAGAAASALAIALWHSQAGALFWGAVCFSLPGLPAPVIFWAMGRHVELLARGMANEFVQGRARGYRSGFIISWLATLAPLPFAGLAPPIALLEVLAVPPLLTFLVYCLILPTYLLRDITRDLQLSEELRQARLPASGN